MRTLRLDAPSEKQEAFLSDTTHKYIAYGGARGGGKTWAVRVKAALLALRYAGIQILIIRRTYAELAMNHIKQLRAMLQGIAVYNDRDKVLNFGNGSQIYFGYCSNDADLLRYQGQEYDVIFIDEATQLTEHQMVVFRACVRGVNDFPKRIYYTCNPGGPGHNYIKRLFIDREYIPGEAPEEYAFYQAFARDNHALMSMQPDYISQLESMPGKLRRAWLDGDWNVFMGQFFEDFQPDPPESKVIETGVEREVLRERRQWCHVIRPMESIPAGWPIYRSFDWGFSKPFSTGYSTVDFDGRVYRIAEYYGCTGEPNEGVKLDPERVFEEMARFEASSPLLRGRSIDGVADPAIWDRSRGPSINDCARKHGISFCPGDNNRIPGWMQMHYRFAFDADGYPMMYIFDTCRAFIRTIPLLMYSTHHPEDLDTDGEDHVADETRYFCMMRPITPTRATPTRQRMPDPLERDSL